MPTLIKLFSELKIKYSLDLADTLYINMLEADFFLVKGTPKIFEISSGYMKKVFEPCKGFSDKDLN